MKKQALSMLMAAAVTVGGVFAGAAPAEAKEGRSEKLWKYGTYAGTAATAAALLKNRDTWAAVGAGATVLSYSQWKKETSRRNRRERQYRPIRRVVRRR